MNSILFESRVGGAQANDTMRLTHLQTGVYKQSMMVVWGGQRRRWVKAEGM